MNILDRFYNKLQDIFIAHFGIGAWSHLLSAKKNKKGIKCFDVSFCKQDAHGDITSNIAMVCHKILDMELEAFAAPIIDQLRMDKDVETVTFLKPGFINIKLTQDFYSKILESILQQGDTFGISNVGQNKRVNVEFVSANPTGLLHVGHMRSAVNADVIANVMEKFSFDVTREYYVNDMGGQITVLLRSIFHEYQLLNGIESSIPDNHYSGKYVEKIAKFVHDRYILLCDNFLANKSLLINIYNKSLEAFQTEGVLNFQEFDTVFSHLVEFEDVLDSSLESINCSYMRISFSDYKDDFLSSGLMFDESEFDESCDNYNLLPVIVAMKNFLYDCQEKDIGKYAKLLDIMLPKLSVPEEKMIFERFYSLFLLLSKLFCNKILLFRFCNFETFKFLKDEIVGYVLHDIKATLKNIAIEHDHFFYESELYENRQVNFHDSITDLKILIKKTIHSLKNGEIHTNNRDKLLSQYNTFEEVLSNVLVNDLEEIGRAHV